MPCFHVPYYSRTAAVWCVAPVTTWSAYEERGVYADNIHKALLESVQLFERIYRGLDEQPEVCQGASLWSGESRQTWNTMRQRLVQASRGVSCQIPVCLRRVAHVRSIKFVCNQVACVCRISVTLDCVALCEAGAGCLCRWFLIYQKLREDSFTFLSPRIHHSAHKQSNRRLHLLL